MSILYKSKLRHTKLGDWVNFILVLLEKTLKNLMIGEKIDQKETDELKEIFNDYIDKRFDIMKNTQFRVEDTFVDIIGKNNINQEQLVRLSNFLAKKI